LLGNDAVKLIQNHNSETPLFLYLTFNAPHTPYQAPEEYLNRYKNIEDPSRRAYAGSITAMDDQIGAVIAALEKKNMRDNTLIVFHSDNGGTRNAMFAGELDMSKSKIPCDNGPYREGKGTLYEGATRVVALANWPNHIKAGSTVDGMLHIVDMYPTLVGLAGGSTSKSKPLDGTDVWPTISEGKPSPRTEVIYNIESFRAGVREGDWKLIWRAPLATSAELFNIAQDPSEKNNVAAQNPEKVEELKKRANELASTMVKSMMLETEFKAVLERLHLPPALPGEEFEFNEEN
jgi:arylsulfatase A-like enzyme